MLIPLSRQRQTGLGNIRILVTGRLSLYYDIELREAIDHSKAVGGMFPTTTLITKQRIFVSVPDTLAEEFKLAKGAKEFFVRFDVLSSDIA